MGGPSKPKTPPPDYAGIWKSYSADLEDITKRYESKTALQRSRMAASDMKAGTQAWQNAVKGMEENRTRELSELSAGDRYDLLKSGFKDYRKQYARGLSSATENVDRLYREGSARDNFNNQFQRYELVRDDEGRRGQGPAKYQKIVGYEDEFQRGQPGEQEFVTQAQVDTQRREAEEKYMAENPQYGSMEEWAAGEYPVDQNSPEAIEEQKIAEEDEALKRAKSSASGGLAASAWM